MTKESRIKLNEAVVKSRRWGVVPAMDLFIEEVDEIIEAEQNRELALLRTTVGVYRDHIRTLAQTVEALEQRLAPDPGGHHA